MFNSPPNVKSNRRSIFLEALVYLLLVFFYVVIVFTLSFFGNMTLRKVLDSGNGFILVPFALLVIAAPYYGSRYLHQWTKTNNTKTSRMVSIIALVVWGLFALGYVQGTILLTYGSLVSMATWLPILYYHYTIIYKRQK